MNQKIKELKLRSKPFQEVEAPWLTDSVLQGQISQHCEQVRAAKKLEENQFLVCFCVWGVRDTHGTGWLKGAFTKSIEERGPKSTANQKIAVVWMHDLRDPIGRVIEMFEDDFGAFAVIELDIDKDNSVPNARRAAYQLRTKTINGWSFGFEYLYDKMEYDEKTDTVWVKEVRLYEISPITFASLKETHTVRSMADYETRKTLLDDETDSFIKSLPKSKQLELRQLISEHISLAQIKPEELPPLEEREPKKVAGELVVGGLKINVNKL